MPPKIAEYSQLVTLLLRCNASESALRLVSWREAPRVGYTAEQCNQGKLNIDLFLVRSAHGHEISKGYEDVYVGCAVRTMSN